MLAIELQSIGVGVPYITDLIPNFYLIPIFELRFRFLNRDNIELSTNTNPKSPG